MSSPVFTIPPVLGRSDRDAELGVPPPERNLFGRIIRNPHSASADPKERECAEMLTAVLQNTEITRDCLLSWLAGFTRHASRPWESRDAHVAIDTEQPIDNKRDDIRITVIRAGVLSLLWSVEVKVGAPLHESSDLTKTADGEAISQLANYESALLQPTQAQHPDADVAGFVLAVHLIHLPPLLSRKWHVLTWSHLAVELEGILRRRNLPATDAFLVKHMLGFIRRYLWRPEEVRMANLELDDIYLIRSFGALGYECERRTNELVAPLAAILASTLPVVGKVIHQKSLFSATGRSTVYGRFAPRDPAPYIYAGIVGKGEDIVSPAAVVWIETTRTAKIKDRIRSAVKKHIAQLQKHDSRWTAHDETSYWDVSISAPLKHMLADPDHAAWLLRFTDKALRDLKETGLTADIAAAAAAVPGDKPSSPW